MMVAQQPTGVELARYLSRQKSFGIGFMLWLLLGTVSAHRFYCGRPRTAALQVLTLLLGLPLAAIAPTMLKLAGAVMVLGWAIWLLVDAFLVKRWIDRHNERVLRDVFAEGGDQASLDAIAAETAQRERARREREARWHQLRPRLRRALVILGTVGGAVYLLLALQVRRVDGALAAATAEHATRLAEATAAYARDKSRFDEVATELARLEGERDAEIDRAAKALYDAQATRVTFTLEDVEMGGGFGVEVHNGSAYHIGSLRGDIHVMAGGVAWPTAFSYELDDARKDDFGFAMGYAVAPGASAQHVNTVLAEQRETDIYENQLAVDDPAERRFVAEHHLKTVPYIFDQRLVPDHACAFDGTITFVSAPRRSESGSGVSYATQRIDFRAMALAGEERPWERHAEAITALQARVASAQHDLTASETTLHETERAAPTRAQFE